MEIAIGYSKIKEETGGLTMLFYGKRCMARLKLWIVVLNVYIGTEAKLSSIVMSTVNSLSAKVQSEREPRKFYQRT